MHLFALTEESKIPRIAVVDDDPRFIKLMIAIGRTRGVVIDGFLNPIEFGWALVGRTYDLIVVDYDLGGVTGVEVAQALASSCSAPVMLVSGHGSHELPLALAPRNLKGFIYKGRGATNFFDQILSMIDHPI
jgi:DNA-binding NtrC family response regulator